MGTHGLFTGGDDEIVLSRIAEEVANHTGNVWIPIISLRRDDAICTGYDKAESWHNMLSYFVPEIAESMKIPIQNFRWYAAFHNESHHPHVHMVCYSTNPTDGYLTKKGIEKMKSGLVKNIFKNEMQLIYAEQTHRRDQLKIESTEILQKFIAEMKSGTIQNPRMVKLFLNLSERLKITTGKKVYGYLQPNLKAIIDEIIDELSKEEVVAKAYELWYAMREDVLHSYMDELPDRLTLSQQKEFKSIKNMIITEADNLSKMNEDIAEVFSAEKVDSYDDLNETAAFEMSKDFSNFDYELTADELDDHSYDENLTFFVKWTDEYKQARDYLFGTDEVVQDFNKARKQLTIEAEKRNVLAIYDLGRIYSNGLGIEKNPDKANDFYVKALAGFQEVESRKVWKYTEYRIGKMFATGLGTEQDYQMAAQWFGLSAEKKYKYAQYSLGALYHRGQGVEQNVQTAFALYLKSAKQGFPYADFEAAKMYRDGIGTEKDEMKSKQHFQKAFSGFEILEKTSHDDKIQYRLGWMLQNGVGIDKNLMRAKDYYEKSSKMGNVFAGYALAKLILKDEYPTDEEIQKAIGVLKSIAEDDNNDYNSIRSMATYTLGKIYLEGTCVVKDINQAVRFLMKSAEEDNQWASYQLGKLFWQGKEIAKDTDKAVAYLTKAAEQENQFAQYILGKIYLFGKDVPRDKGLAIKWLTRATEQGNEYAKFFLDNMDKFSQPSVSLCVSRMLNHMGRIFEENMPFHKPKNEMKIDSKLLRKLRAKKMAQGYKQNNMEQEMLP
jgi:FOG: TPR repeat, SEL1 subfamily